MLFCEIHLFLRNTCDVFVCLFVFQAGNCSALGGETVGKKCSTLQRGRKPDCSKFVKTCVGVECVHQVGDAVDVVL